MTFAKIYTIKKQDTCDDISAVINYMILFNFLVTINRLDRNSPLYRNDVFPLKSHAFIKYLVGVIQLSYVCI